MLGVPGLALGQISESPSVLRLLASPVRRWLLRPAVKSERNAMKPIRQTVRRVDQSPLNKERWCLTLGCGHEIWKTSKSKPKQGQLVKCPQCVEKRRK